MEKYIYICAAARSGSTLLDMLLGGHSKGASLGEFNFLGKAIALKQLCGCGSTVDDCEKWNKVYTQLKLDKGVDLKQTPYACSQWDTRASAVIDFEQQTRTYVFFSKLRVIINRLHLKLPPLLQPKMPKSRRIGIENTVYLYNIILKCWNKSFVINSSKNYLQAISLYKRAPKKTKIILLTRDGRGVFCSRYYSGFTKQESFRGWHNYYSKAFDYLSRYVRPNDLYILRYEDLMADLEGELKKICDWAGIEYEAQMSDLSSGERHLVNGNATRFNRDKGVRLDERWKTELKKEDLDWFMARGGKLNLKLGYKA